MTNVYLIPTGKPSRLWINNLLQGKLEIEKEVLIGSNTAHHIYITSDEEIKGGDWCIVDGGLGRIGIDKVQTTIRYSVQPKKIILTTDKDLIADGVQAIDDEFLEWFINNPNHDSVKVRSKMNHPRSVFGYEIIIP